LDFCVFYFVHILVVGFVQNQKQAKELVIMIVFIMNNGYKLYLVDMQENRFAETFSSQYIFCSVLQFFNVKN